MTEIQQRLLGLLSEIDNICKQIDVHFWLAGFTADKALRFGTFTDKEIEAEIWMQEKEFYKFAEWVKEKKDNRKIEGINMNPKFPGTYFLYVDTNTLLYDLDNISCFKSHGAAIKINLLRDRINSKYICAVNRYSRAIIELSHTRKEKLQKESLKKRIIYWLCLLFQQITGYKVASFVYCWSDSLKYKVETEEYYINRWNKSLAVIPKKYFQNSDRVQLEGNAFLIPSNLKSILDKTKGKQVQGIRKEKLTIITDMNIPYERYLKEVEKQRMIPKSFVRKRRQYVYMLETELNPYKKAIQDKWNLLFMTGERYRLWKKYVPLKMLILERYEQKKMEDLGDILAEYLTVLEEFEKKHYGICFDKDIWNIAMETLRYQGKMKEADNLEKYVFPEHMEEIIL